MTIKNYRQREERIGPILNRWLLLSRKPVTLYREMLDWL